MVLLAASGEAASDGQKQWNPASKNTYRGYFPIVPGRVENKEGLEIGSDLPPDHPFLKAGYTVYENNLWSEVDDNCPNFIENCPKVLRFMNFTDVSTEVIRLLCIAVGMGYVCQEIF